MTIYGLNRTNITNSAFIYQNNVYEQTTNINASVNASNNGIIFTKNELAMLYSNIDINYDAYWSEQFGTNIYFKANPI